MGCLAGEQDKIELGGYLELELPASGEGFHETALALNSGRNALRYVLEARGTRSLALPRYICDSVLEPAVEMGIETTFYHLDDSFEIVDEPEVGERCQLLYVNYFGLKANYCAELAGRLGDKLILDYSHSFHRLPLGGIDTFYSARKFFGVPDGSFLYTTSRLPRELERDVSWDRTGHLLGRIDEGASVHHSAFTRNEEALSGTPVRWMSKLTHRILAGVDHSFVRSTRTQNHLFLHAALKEANELAIPGTVAGETTIAYPYLRSGGAKLRQHLWDERIYVPILWPSARERTKPGSVEERLVEELIPLPIDQRYSTRDMTRIIRAIERHE